MTLRRLFFIKLNINERARSNYNMYKANEGLKKAEILMSRSILRATISTCSIVRKVQVRREQPII